MYPKGSRGRAEDQTQIAAMLGERQLKLNESILLRRQICGNALAAAPQYDIINFRYPIAGAKPGAATLGAESVFPETAVEFPAATDGCRAGVGSTSSLLRSHCC